GRDQGCGDQGCGDHGFGGGLQFEGQQKKREKRKHDPLASTGAPSISITTVRGGLHTFLRSLKRNVRARKEKEADEARMETDGRVLGLWNEETQERASCSTGDGL